ncbi:MAG: enoyl-CoA hydratase/isomerase family protein [Planctomycetes bacterium]|nr:enoyl-CoA hydratase/isomerase family protein [Planctomycetota bacterium]
MDFDSVGVHIESGLAVITVNRPTKLNALDNETISELFEAFTMVSADADVGVIILTGAGEKAFVAGADVSVLAEQGVLDGRTNSAHGQMLMHEIEQSPKPVLAAIHGYALGGGLELALACDLRFASTKARLGLPEVSLGLIPGYGGTQRLPRLIGIGPALQMILTGDPIDADTALRLGLVNAVFEPAELLDEVTAVARKILSRGPQAVTLAKAAVRRGADVPLAEGLRIETDLFGIISATEEMREGTRAFLEKRDPSWRR